MKDKSLWTANTNHLPVIPGLSQLKMEYPEKPPPSYDETFPEVVQNSCTSTADSERGGNDDENNSTSTTDLLFDVENALKFVSNIDVITVPGSKKSLII